MEARKKNGFYEIPYGHHRLAALKKLGIKEIEVTIQNLSDHEMIKRMANENMDIWKTDMNVIRETVRVAKEFLDNNPDHLRKYGDDNFKGGVEKWISQKS
jgi:nuclear transport factor 2 (NTF2) superfamily protein